MPGQPEGTGVTAVFSAHIDRVSVAEQVYRHLRSAILGGEIPQASRVVEAQIAKSLNISRAPVREAVNRLLQEGLIESKTHFGPSVIQMTPEKIRWLYEVRAAIESLAIREVVRRRKDLDLAPLRASVTEMKRLASKKNLAGLVEAELRFHRILCELAGNPYIVKVSAIIDGQVRMALTVDNAHYANLNDVANEHEPIIAVIESGEADTASAHIVRHIFSSLEAIESGRDAGREAPFAAAGQTPKLHLRRRK